jgi:hypothetical protein
VIEVLAKKHYYNDAVTHNVRLLRHRAKQQQTSACEIGALFEITRSDLRRALAAKPGHRMVQLWQGETGPDWYDEVPVRRIGGKLLIGCVEFGRNAARQVVEWANSGVKAKPVGKKKGKPKNNS